MDTDFFLWFFGMSRRSLVISRWSPEGFWTCDTSMLLGRQLGADDERIQKSFNDILIWEGFGGEDGVEFPPVTFAERAWRCCAGKCLYSFDLEGKKSTKEILDARPPVRCKANNMAAMVTVMERL